MLLNDKVSVSTQGGSNIFESRRGQFYQAAYWPRPNQSNTWNKIEIVISSFLESYETV